MTTTKLRKLQRLSPEELAYVAGFLDGDGSVCARIVKRPDYRLKFEIRISLSFFQKTTRHWFLIQLQNQLHYGSLRKQSNGMSEYTICERDSVKHCLERLRPYVKIKQRQVRLCLQILNKITKTTAHHSSHKQQEPKDFWKLCQLVDEVARWNDSKRRKVTSETVRSLFVELGMIDKDDV